MTPDRLISLYFVLLVLLIAHELRSECGKLPKSEAAGQKNVEAKIKSADLKANNVTTNDSVPNIDRLVQQFNAKMQNMTGENEPNWRAGKSSLAEKMRYMLKTKRMTDSSLIVGPNENTRTFEAHSVVLAAASPIFEYALSESRSLRIQGWLPDEFEKFLNFVYSENLCFDGFDEACTLLYHAANWKIEGAKDEARKFIYLNMYPDYIWDAFYCAKKAQDEVIQEFASELISEFSSQTLKDRKLNDLSKTDLANLLAQDDLNVQSEVEVFEAVARWGLMQVINSGKTPTTPELIREKIGPDVFRQIRFLTMTGTEFARTHTSTQLLSYEEGLAVLLNINSPGSIQLPNTVCNITKKREFKKDLRKTFITLGSSKSKCADDGSNYSPDTLDLFTVSIIPNADEWQLVGIQIPKSLEATANCTISESFDVLILDLDNRTVDKFSYNYIIPSCSTLRVKSDLPPGRIFAVNDSEVMNVKFERTVKIPSVKTVKGPERYRIKIVFKEARTYPVFVDAGTKMKAKDSNEMKYELYSSTFDFEGDKTSKYRLLQNPQFVYALITKS
ncbi:uncharacterized protein LOC135936913 [Cloeon dipterum]|uniref:uncharacterized protein LOC135936913 n=1 Tax=Cloeon dipterum TaxID=197152 RepID=UPI00321F85C3